MLLAGPNRREYTARRSTVGPDRRSSMPARGRRVSNDGVQVSQRTSAWWPVVAWTLVIILLTGIPLPTLPGAAGSELDKLVHFALYFGLGWTLARAARLSGFRGVAALVGLLLAGVGFAALDELLQSWVPRRAPQLADWLADVAGLLTAYVMYMVLWRYRWKAEAP